MNLIRGYIPLWSAVTLLALGSVWLIKPWHQSWWPGRHEASSVPSACAAVDLPSVRQAVYVPQVQPGQAAREDSEFRSIRSCTWTIADDLALKPGLAGAGLKIEYMLLRGGGGSDGGIESAKKQFAAEERVLNAGQVRVDRIGDEAFASATHRRIVVVARRSNVVVKLSLTVPVSKRSGSLVDAERLERIAVDKIRLDA